MRTMTRIAVLLAVLLLALPSNPGMQVNASPSACPEGGCLVYLPIVKKPIKIGLVTDTGGINDASFNQSAWQAVLDAQTNLGASGAYLESHSTSDYATNINNFMSQGYDLIITVGFTMRDATQAAAQAHPNQKFTIVDAAYNPILANVIGQSFTIEQCAFLSGYLAAGTTAKGKVATFGGMPIPQVTQFMDGYVQGVAYYNQQKGATVQVLGWDPVAKTGEFTNDFNNPVAGLQMGQKLLGQGADIIFPVAGSTGLGAAQAVQSQGNAWVIGVDTDWTVSEPEYSDVVLTSAIKNVRTSTGAVIQLAVQNNFLGGTYIGNLANQAVGLGTISTSVPQARLTELEQVKASIIAGTIIVNP
jgi:basic membrane protein A